MNLQTVQWLADENVSPPVVAWLRERGSDVISTVSVGLNGATDDAVLAAALSSQRVVLTHDRDFGRLTLARLERLTGIVYVRPGHIAASTTIRALSVLFDNAPDVDFPFIIVVETRGNAVHVRVRRL